MNPALPTEGQGRGRKGGVKVYIIGVGPGAKDHVLPVARSRIEKCDCLIGAERLLSLFRVLGKEEVCTRGHLDKVIPYIKKYKNKKKIAVLLSGDPGMHSLLGKISKSLKPREYTVIPGISTVQLAFARIGEGWSDAKIISLHGRTAHGLANEIRASAKSFLFTDAGFPPNRIAGHLLKEGLENRRAVVLENLSYPDERIIDTDLRRLSRMNPAPSSASCLSKAPRGLGRRGGVKAGPLCAMIIESRKRQKTAKGKLYGIGIGPGDPRLITLRAKELLDKVDIVFVPKSSDEGTSLARTIVEAVTTTPKVFRELTFPMTKDRSILGRYWKRAANIIAARIKKGSQVAFVTIGDPLIYSTYVYLLKTLRDNFPDIEVETIPGISAFNAAASAASLALVEGNEALAVVPVTKDLKGLREPLEKFDTVVLMKVGSKLDKVISLLKELGLAGCATLISRVGHKDEKMMHGLTSLRDKKAGYLSVIIVKRPKAP